MNITPTPANLDALGKSTVQLLRALGVTKPHEHLRNIAISVAVENRNSVRNNNLSVQQRKKFEAQLEALETTDTEQLEALAQSQFLDVRENVATNPATPNSVLLILAFDKDALIAELAVSHLRSRHTSKKRRQRDAKKTNR